VAHLLGPFAAGVKERDALPALAATAEHPIAAGEGG
jgi:hypothetical protein